MKTSKNDARSKEIEDFRASLPERNRNEHFQYFMISFDIVKARFITQGRPAGWIDVENTAKLSGLNYKHKAPARKKGEWQSLPMPLVGVDEKRALKLPKAALETPVIIAHFRIDGGIDANVMIDGYHRLFKAFNMGIEKLPAVAISEIESDWLMTIRKV